VRSDGIKEEGKINVPLPGFIWSLPNKLQHYNSKEDEDIKEVLLTVGQNYCYIVCNTHEICLSVSV